MKRLLVVALVIVLFALLVLPGAVGWVAEREHTRLLDHAQAGGYELETEGYRRGWFASDARHRYRIDQPWLLQLAQAYSGDGDVSTLLIDSHLRHGPMPAIAGGQGSLFAPAWTEAASTLALRGDSGDEHLLPGRLTSRIEPDGGTHLSYRAEPGRQALDTQFEVAWQKSALDLFMNRDGDQLEFDASLGGLVLRDATTAVELGQARVRGQQQRAPSGLWTGSSAGEVDKLIAPRFAATGIGFRTQLDLEQGRPAVRVVSDIEHLSTEVLDGADARFDVGVRGVNAGAFAGFLELAATGQPLDLFAPAQRPLLSRLLADGPDLELHQLRVPFMDSAIEGTAQLRIAPGTDADGPFADALTGRADILVPRVLVHTIADSSTDQWRAAIELMIQFRVLKAEGDRYRIDARYANGILNVNGFPVPLPAF